MVFSIALLTLFRVGLMIWQHPHLTSLNDVVNVLFGGLRIDLSVLSYLVLLPVVIYWFTVLLGANWQVWVIRIIQRWCWFWFMVLLFMELLTPVFISEYGLRPNRLFFEYLGNPKEIWGMVISGYLGVTLMIMLIMWTIGVISWKQWLCRPLIDTRTRDMKYLLLTLVLIPVLVLAGRSGLQHRPINAAMVAFSHDDLLNKLALNSTYSTLQALYAMKNEADVARQYGRIAEQDMLSILRAELGADVSFDVPDLPTVHYQKTQTKMHRPKDLLIVVEESLGAQFVGSLGGVGVTPNIDSWQGRSWFFEQLYATGTRSARGLEAIVTGFPPSPARSVLKLPNAQSNFFTLAQLLSKEGYQSTFIYGGESHFDNMKGFFLANGFDQVIDQNDYLSPEFTGTWGVSDEDLFAKTWEHIEQGADQPQFTLVFSSSNHTPFEFPDGKIKLHDPNKATVNNAVKYADFALGQFLAQLEQAHFFEKAVVLVVADHDARVKGEQLVPVKRFHIPGFIIGSEVNPRNDSRLVSQIDLAPTLLSLIGIDSVHPMLGFDLTNNRVQRRNRVLMQYGDNQAYMNDQELVVLQPQKAPVCFKDADVNAEPVTCHFDDIALAYAQFSSWAYEYGKYRLP